MFRSWGLERQEEADIDGIMRLGLFIWPVDPYYVYLVCLGQLLYSTDLNLHDVDILGGELPAYPIS